MAEIEIDGTPADPARLAALGLLNYGHFTTLRVEAGRVRGLELHLDRLVRDCRTLFAAELDRAAVRERIRAVLPADGAPVIVRVTVYDPALGLERPAAPAPLRTRATVYRRELPEVKHVGLFGLVHHRRLAQLAGYDDVLLTDEHGLVSEGATWNVGFLAGDRLVWPEGPSLPGVTEALLAGAYGGPQSREPVRVAELGRFDAAFAVNAGVGPRPLAAVDSTAFDPAHPRLAELRAAYLGIAADEL
ncbi:aminotransferase class IV [Streptomyces sp. FH025]|uniref:aminotransferase class IV n=1 Tax=Streptomyces sp. FH025 TaxID=2815937 RepID=UPI001A9EAF52|nr:aminotransferase class IV [Streptomyces sp. FH025]MBO1416605.1 aminotransferase class IV [Streptomyces sp. FH025]